ncbi:MAG: N-acetylglucosamine-6-phosphate deacetylase [Planctomycetota bacterium]|jgi:N-acetylglucosamine-6-phosphate deacetylase
MTRIRGVDLQVNGFRGVDFSSPDLTPETFAEACRGVLERGTRAFLPTVITSSEETYARNLPLIAEAIDAPDCEERLLGIHLEGPFISPEPGAVGAHSPEWVREPDAAFLDTLIDLARGQVRMLTLAADRAGAPELVEHAVSRGIVVSLGHHLATAADLARSAEAGAMALTHLGNGVPNSLPRHPNPIWAGLAEDRLAMMVIADGHHLPSETLVPMVRAKGVGNTIVTSDASALAGMPPGRYRAMGNDVVIEEDGRLHNPQKGCLVGSSATMPECVEHLVKLGEWSEAEIERTCVANPLALIGVDPSDVPA